MKTFKLILLEIVDEQAETYQAIRIPLHDGLIINQEDDKNTWMIEAYTGDDLSNYFASLQDKGQKLIVHVKITTELNEKATCLMEVIEINKINDKISVLLIGPMLKHRTEKLEQTLADLITSGKRGEELVMYFKETIR